MREDDKASYNEERRCYTSEMNEISNVTSILSQSEIRKMWLELGTKGKDQIISNVSMLSQYESCFCYGWTAEEDPMSAYLRMMREVETAEG